MDEHLQNVSQGLATGISPDFIDKTRHQADVKKRADRLPEGTVIEVPLKERVGKLTMGTVNNLADDPDEIITTLKGIDFGKQDLDILIELSK